MPASNKKVQPATPFDLGQLNDQLRPYWPEVFGGTILLLTLITLLSLAGLTGGTLSDWWAEIFTRLFGWGAIPGAALLAVLGLYLALHRLFAGELETDDDIPTDASLLPLDIVVGLELLFVVGLAIIHLVAAEPGEQALQAAQTGVGGGLVGWGISRILIDFVGPSLTAFILFIIGAGAIAFTLRVGVADIAHWADQISLWAQNRLQDHSPATVLDIDDLPPVEPPPPDPPIKQAQKKANSGQKLPKPLPPPTLTAEAVRAAMPQTQYKLPPFDLLSPPAKDPGNNANTRYQAQIIEETLYGFGIPVEVAEVNRGPTVTQFGLKLGTIERKLPDGNVVQQRVRVNKIVALSNDLALALSAAPLRIEAPVPGRPLVGIEIPNVQKTMVSLREVLDSPSFKKTKGPLPVALGKGVSGQPVAASLAGMPHLLIAGSTGSGKSVCVNGLISSLLFTYTPDQLKLLMVDPKMVELTSYNGIPHLVAPVVTNFEEVVGALAWVTREMERRYKLFADAGARSIDTYNKKMGTRSEQLPYLVVIIDELADLMMMAPDEVERHLCRIAQMARATGIHVVIATQRPSVDVVTGLIKANFPTRIAFAVTGQIDSRVILDSPGAERLLGRGDMLYMAADSPKLARLQGCFVSDAEINNLVNFWKASVAISTPTDPTPADGADIEKPGEPDPPWAGIMAEVDKDDLLEDAVKIVVESGRASTSMLQRRLGIGYPRASRLMDQLEGEGVVGPQAGSKPREVLWQDDDDDDGGDYEEFEHDVAGDILPDDEF